MVTNMILRYCALVALLLLTLLSRREKVARAGRSHEQLFLVSRLGLGRPGPPWRADRMLGILRPEKWYHCMRSGMIVYFYAFDHLDSSVVKKQEQDDGPGRDH